MKIAVGSKNPVKIKSVEIGFQKVWPNEKFEITGFAVESGVAAQPMTDEESITGARNRAKLAIAQNSADFGVGLEGGLQKIANEWFDSGWIVIISADGREGIASTAKFLMPNQFMELIMQGQELGEVSDKIFNKVNANKAEGFMGLITNNLVDRTAAYTEAVIVALSRFLNSQVFD